MNLKPKKISKKIKASGYLSSDELLSFLKDGATIDPNTRNIVRFAKKNIKIKRFGRIGSSAVIPHFSRDQIQKKLKILYKNPK